MIERRRSGAVPRWGRHPAAIVGGAVLLVVGAIPAPMATHHVDAAEVLSPPPPGSGFVLPATHADVDSGATPPQATASKAVLPKTLTDVDGDTVDVAKLATGGRLVVVTLKATWCPVCQEQLVRLRKLLPRLRSCNATFIVLAPGPADELRAIARDTGFPYPFVEDQNLAIARAADLILAPDQIAPAMFALDPDRSIAWIQRGRSGSYYGDPELLERLDCEPLGTA